MRLWVVAAVLVGMLSMGSMWWGARHAVVPLYQVGVAHDSVGAIVELSPESWTEQDLWGSGRRVLALGLTDEQRSVHTSLLGAAASTDQLWLARGTVPGQDTTFEGMSVRALLDIHLLTAPTGAAPGAILAAASPNWAYVWPRDAAFVAVAYAETGHGDEALEVLGFLADQQATNGSFEARYLPEGGQAVPDARESQEDGPGWALWAAAMVLQAQPTQADRDIASTALRPLILASTARLLAQVDPQTHLPAVSADYWEVPEDELTLGVAATTANGLDWAAWITEQGWVSEGEWRASGIESATVSAQAERTREAVIAEFGPTYPRTVEGSVDAALTFLQPPLARCAYPDSAEALASGVEAMARPAGGIAPGAGWKLDGVSWTPETALLGLVASAQGDQAETERWLNWLNEHRTEAGSLPEKVMYDGQPGAVAPLAWTAATVLITMAQDESDVESQMGVDCTG